jgi:microtubule-associated protein, RP/EB family
VRRAGAVALQLLDRLYPGEVPMRKVRWDAKTTDQMVGNYKLVQALLSKKGVDRDVPIERLVRAKYQDNLEMMQWFKHFYESNKGPETEAYDAVGRRALGRGAELMPIYAPGGGVRTDSVVGTVRRVGGAAAAAAAPSAPMSSGSAAPATLSRTVNRASLERQGKGEGGAAAGGGAGVSAAAAGGATAASRAVGTGTGSSSGGGGGGAVATGSARERELRRDLAEARVLASGLERERDFYFAKLRDIEILAQQYKGPDKAFCDQVFKILYATVDEFVDPEEAGVADADADANAGRSAAPARAAGDDIADQDIRSMISNDHLPPAEKENDEL